MIIVENYHYITWNTRHRHIEFISFDACPATLFAPRDTHDSSIFLTGAMSCEEMRKKEKAINERGGLPGPFLIDDFLNITNYQVEELLVEMKLTGVYDTWC